LRCCSQLLVPKRQRRATFPTLQHWRVKISQGGPVSRSAKPTMCPSPRRETETVVSAPIPTLGVEQRQPQSIWLSDETWFLTMRLSDAGLRGHPTKLIYPDHRSSPWLTEDAPRDRSNRLLDHPENHKTGGSTFSASRRRKRRIRHSTSGIIIEGAPANPTMNHRHSGVTG